MNTITIDDEGNFNASGKLKTKYPESIQLATTLDEAMTAYVVLGDAYGRFIAGDQKLIGQEKASIKHVLENMMLLLITVRFHLSRAYLDEFYPMCKNLEEGFSYSMHLDDFDFAISGELSARTYDSFKSFREWYTDIFAEPLKKFLNDLKVALKDNKLTKEEVEWLNRRLDSMIHLQLIMHYKLDHSRLGH